jgi:hypothetical protein
MIQENETLSVRVEMTNTKLPLTQNLIHMNFAIRLD